MVPMNFIVMGAAEPSDFQWLEIVIAMTMSVWISALFARAFCDYPIPHCLLKFMASVQAHSTLIVTHVVRVFSVPVGAKTDLAIFGLSHFVSEVPRFFRCRLAHTWPAECRIATLLTGRYVELINGAHLFTPKAPSFRLRVFLPWLMAACGLLVLPRPCTASSTPFDNHTWFGIRAEVFNGKGVLASRAYSLLHNYNYTYNRVSSQAVGGG